MVCLGLLAAGLCGCVMSYEEGRVGPLGDSVNHTLYQQIADKEVAANPGTEVPTSGTDGPLTERIMDGYRGRVGDAERVVQPIQINIGN
ncbi:hypothetical protein D3C76_869830 [compost metagenome]